MAGESGTEKRDGEDGAEATFHRPPRDRPDPPPTDELRVHAPPTKPEPPTGGLMQAAFPALGSMGMVGFALVYRNTLFLYIAVGMVFLSILMVIGMRWSQARSVKKRRISNRRKYRAYLNSVERQLAEDANAQLVAADRLYPDHERLWGLVLSRRHLWERRAQDPDFLTVRVGRGPVPHTRPIRLELGDDPITEREADLEDEAATVRKRWARVTDVPVVIDLDAAQVVSVVGPPASTRALARSMVSQLAAFRAPNDLRVLAAFDPEDKRDWEWMKWLPHVRSSAQQAKGAKAPPVLLADSPELLARLLDGELGPRLEQLGRIDEQGSISGRETPLAGPRLVIIVDGFSPKSQVARLASIRDVMERGDRLQTTLILLTDAPEREPSEADVRMVLTPSAATIEERRGDARRRSEGVWPDAADRGLCEAVARSLAPLRLEDHDSDAPVTDDVRMLDLIGHRSAADIDPAQTWREHSPRERLRVPIGVTAGGEPLALDLKEAAQGGQGPHGLIVGATGSGKSELLRTLVAGLAVNQSPDDLSFVLIDYKGGSAFAELARLPHAAGLITNLQRDAALVDRMRDALLGEQERRQGMLRDAGDLDDIRAYRTARERDRTLEPMPNLLVVVDEFGELMAARPEFIDLFLGIGRVGRSLGMHLLFSSQRLEEGRLRGLETNLRYRICLRTYSAAESKIVLGTPDAYLLPPFPGAAYLKVDTGVYERFKVALISGSRAAPSVPAVSGPSVQLFSSSLPGLEPDQPEQEESEQPEGPSDLEAIVSLLGDAHGGVQVHQVWVPPLTESIDLAEVVHDEPWWERADEASPRLDAAVGLVDLPSEQRTEPLVLDFEGRSGHLALVGAPQSGKSTFLRTLAASLMSRHRPDEVRIYAIDLGGGGLSSLAGLPHVSGVAAKAGRDEVRQTVRHMQALLARREARFRELGLNSMADARAARAKPEHTTEDLADVFLIVDGWASLRSDFEGLDRDLEQIAVEGLNFGVHLVITSSRWAEMRPGLRDNIGSRLELRLNDPIESELGRRVAEKLPTDVPGRGLTSAKLHFQTAMAQRDALDEPSERWDGPPAPPVPVLPTSIPISALPDPEDSAGPGVPVGVDELALEPVYLDLTASDPHFLVLGDGESGKTNLLRLFARGLMARQDPGRAQISIIDYRRGLIDLSDEAHVRAYAANAAMAADALAQLRSDLEARLPGSDVSREEMLRGPSWSGPRQYLLVDDYDLVPSATENPLTTLIGLLAHGRDVGLHLIVTRRVGGMSTSAFEGFMQRLLELRTPGLLMNGSSSEGNVLGGHRARALPAGRGLLIRREGEPGLVQTALAPRDEPEATPLRGRTRAKR
jgi:DNA segregation ATPase FtsK/SpoIIIE, S-DNA-T family